MRNNSTKVVYQIIFYGEIEFTMVKLVLHGVFDPPSVKWLGDHFLADKAVDEAAFQKITTASSTKTTWDILAKSYQGMAKVNIVKFYNTRREFQSLHMKETKNIDSFMNQILTIINQSKIYGDNIKYQIVVEKVLGFLSTRFDVVVGTIEEAKDLAILTIDELMGTLLF